MAVKKKPGQQGNQPPPDDDDDDGDAGGLSDEARTEITNLVNAAVSGQLSRKLPAAITAAVEGAIAPLRESLGSGRRRTDDDDGGDPDDDDDTGQQQQRGKRGQQQQARGRAKDPEVESMRKQLAKLTQEREQERTTARNRERDTMLREQLEAAGVDKLRVRGAIAVLRDSMKYDEKAGEWVYNAKREGFDEPIDVSAGVSEWASTDEGKSYLAPPTGQQNGQQQRGGSGVRPAGGNGGTGAGAPRLQNGGRPTQDPKAAKQQAKQQAVQNLSSAIDQLAGGTIPLG